jgi:hypothetical protein
MVESILQVVRAAICTGMSCRLVYITTLLYIMIAFGVKEVKVGERER